MKTESAMRKWTLIGISFFLLNQTIPAQDQVGCTQLLEDAREAYQAGMVELVPELLNPCLESGLAGEALQEAYKLVINAYLFDYLPDQADNLMKDFVGKFPDYSTAPDDPGEFVLLFEKHHQELVRQQITARQQEQQERERQAEITRRQQVDRRETPVEKKQFGTLGFALGGNIALPRLTEKYSIGDPALDAGSFTVSGPGFHVGGIWNLNLGRSSEATFELRYTRLHLRYDGAPFSFVSYQYQEYQNFLGIPVSMAVMFNPRSRVNVYMRFGMEVDYLISAAASATRSYTETGSIYLRDVELEKTKITVTRKPMSLMGSGGLGIKFPFSGGKIFLEPRFHYGFLLSNNPEHRYDTQDLTWLIYHVDSDFRVNYLTLSFGMVWNLHKSQKL